MSTIQFRVKRLSKTAQLPSRSRDSDLWDLYADSFKDVDRDEYTLESGDRVLVCTGISLEFAKLYSIQSYTLPYNTPGRWYFDDERTDPWMDLEAYAVADIRPRSGLAINHGITVLNTPGTVDHEYRGEICVILVNTGAEPYTIKKGDKVAQMLIRPLHLSKMAEVTELTTTDRGEKGFGSSGR